MNRRHFFPAIAAGALTLLGLRGREPAKAAEEPCDCGEHVEPATVVFSEYVEDPNCPFHGCYMLDRDGTLKPIVNVSGTWRIASCD